MAILIERKDLEASLESLADAAKLGSGRFLTTKSVDRLIRLKSGLQIRQNAGTPFVWRSDEPIETGESRTYKGNAADRKPYMAEITFELHCSWRKSAMLISEGWINVRFRKAGAENNSATDKQIHYDICEGGARDEGAAHPPFHVQFNHGSMNDVPRLPFFIISLPDVIDFTLHELFQGQWRNHVLTRQGAKQKMTKHVRLQRDRLQRTLCYFLEALNNEKEQDLPLAAFTKPLKEPLGFS